MILIFYSTDTIMLLNHRKILMLSLETFRQMGQRCSSLALWQGSQRQRCPHSQIMLTLLFLHASHRSFPQILALNYDFSPKWCNLALLTSPRIYCLLLRMVRMGRQNKVYPTAAMEKASRSFQKVALQIFSCQNSASRPITLSASPFETTMNSGSRMKRCSVREYPMAPQRARRCPAFRVQVRRLLSEFLCLFSSRKTMHFSLRSSNASSSMWQSLMSTSTLLPPWGSLNQNLPPA